MVFITGKNTRSGKLPDSLGFPALTSLASRRAPLKSCGNSSENPHGQNICLWIRHSYMKRKRAEKRPLFPLSFSSLQAITIMTAKIAIPAFYILCLSFSFFIRSADHVLDFSYINVKINQRIQKFRGQFRWINALFHQGKDNPKTKDEAMRQVADFVYNVFKYHLVKYLGLFDVFFRYQVSKLENIDIENVAGLGLLLQKLEYNALSPNARKVSDYGVPFKLIDCYDSKTQYDKSQFDAYEQHIDQEISRLFR